MTGYFSSVICVETRKVLQATTWKDITHVEIKSALQHTRSCHEVDKERKKPYDNGIIERDMFIWKAEYHYPKSPEKAIQSLRHYWLSAIGD